MTKTEHTLKNTIGHEYFHPDGTVYVPKKMALIAMKKYAKESFEAAKEGGIKKIPVLIDQYGSVNIEEHFVPNLYPTFENYENAMNEKVNQ